MKKKSLILATAFAMALGVGVAVGAHQSKAGVKEVEADSYNVYFNINGKSNLKQGNERYAAYVWNASNTASNAWVDLGNVGGDIYGATVDKTTYNSIIFARMNGSNPTNSWDNKWDQSNDLSLTNSTVYFRATSESTGGNFSCEAYTPVYGLVGDVIGWGNDVDMAINGVEASVTQTLAENESVKIRADKDWAVSYGYSSLSGESKALFNDDGGNIKAKAAGTYTFTLNFATGIIEASLNVTKYTVHVYINGTERGTGEEIVEGSLPVAPEIHYGESFTGWFSDSECTKGNEVSAITSNTTVYGKVITAPSIYYSANLSFAGFTGEKTYLYAWTGSEYNHEWPGVEIDPTSFAVPSSASFIVNDGVGHQTVDVEQSGVNNDELVVANTFDGEGHNEVVWKSTIDKPEATGYYISGLEDKWDYAHAIKMNNTIDPQPGEDVAVSGKLHFEVEDQIRVRSYYEDRYPFDQWANAGDDFSKIDYGKKTGDNFEFTKEGDYIIYAKYEDDAFKFYVGEYNEPDIPTKEGYYICGLDGFRYENATEMTSVVNPGEGENVAYYMNLSVKANDEIIVRSYFEDQEPKDRWSEPGDDFSKIDYGERDGNNFKFLKDGYYDIYAKYVGENFRFFVAQHVESHSVALTAVLFNGKVSEGTQDLAPQIAYEGQEFEPELAREGYVLLATYTDEEMEHVYVPAEIKSDDVHLYAKYMKVGFYVIAEKDNWKLEEALPMNTAGIADTNKAEAYLNVKENELYSFVEYKADGTMAGQSGLGEGVDPLLATYDATEGGRVKFLKDASVAVYFGKDNNIYLNEGLVAFLTNFKSDVGGVCLTLDPKASEEQKAAYMTALKAAWGRQAVAFNNLTADEKAEFNKETHDESIKVLYEEMTAMYDYIIHKYGTSEFNDFIWNQDVKAVGNSMPELSTDSNVMLIVIISISAVSVASLGALLILKKKKRK